MFDNLWKTPRNSNFPARSVKNGCCSAILCEGLTTVTLPTRPIVITGCSAPRTFERGRGTCAQSIPSSRRGVDIVTSTPRSFIPTHQRLPRATTHEMYQEADMLIRLLREE